ncbi:MAG: AAA family ATPase [Solirubrobacteraceae bacterium]|nr:AAA family ATPase [Solirubrobacteraceae bacterium]
MTDGVRSDTGLIEREAALKAVDELLAAARAASGELLFVEGHAGVGKSALLDAAVGRARTEAMTVLRARPSEQESAFQFAIALQLFEPLLMGADDEARDRLLAGSAALAGPLLERPTSWGGDEAEDRSYPVMHGLFWLLSNLAETGPVLVVIDDAHWADRASLRLVLYLLQRLDRMRVAIIAARRLGEPGAPDDLLAQIATHVSSRRVRPSALSRHGARRMVAAGLAGADEAFADACWRMTEGNAFLLEELIGAVHAEAWKPTAQNADRIGTLAPETVLRAVAVRLMRLSDDAAGVARAVAVLGDDAQPRRVAALTGHESARVAAAADALAASDILRPADPDALTFAHPLLASAVYSDIATGERAVAHRRAAEILRDDAIAPERVAAHLLLSPGSGEPWAVETLGVAAGRALVAGAPESAANYLRRALEEPPQAPARAPLLRRLGACEAATGLPSAIGRLEESLAYAVGDDQRAQTLLALGRAQAAAGSHAAALASFDEAGGCVAAGADGSAAVEQALAEAGSLGVLFEQRRAALLAPSGGPPGGAGTRPAALLAMDGLHGTLRGAPRDDVLALVRAALDGDRTQLGGQDGGSLLFAVSAALYASDELAWADRVLTAAADRARSRGSTIAYASAILYRAVARWSQGRLGEALDDAEAAIDAQRYGWRHLVSVACGVVAGIHLDRGELDTASAVLARHDPTGGERSAMLAPWYEQHVRLAMRERRAGDALAHCESWRDVVTEIVNPACLAGWRSASAYALVSLERRAEARRLATEELELARAFGAPRAISVALRALAHVEAGGKLERPIALLEEAAALVAPSEARLEHCRAQLQLGTALRRAGRRSEAGRALGEALEIARACGARLVEERALSELEVAGARLQRAALRGADALSPSERRVVALAIEGLSNRQIAEALFVTRKAVEWHLGNAYRKLDVRSRHELADALSE